LVTLTFDLLTLKVVVSVKRDVGYLNANFSLPMPLCFRLRRARCTRQTDRQTLDRQTDRQTDVRRASSYNAPALSDVGIISKKMYIYYLQFCLDIVSQSRIAQ